ncbi:MAG: GNAT family N-acetyltransferase [Spirochaetaceae bacterium]|nr:MAG: GNAT family N-acetyltransferase [Spirochaetaceae bacterium]
MNWIDLAADEDPAAIEAELTPDTVVTRFMQLSIHIIHGWDKPACMKQIGVIREREFRRVGAGRNLPRDIDALDTTPGTYRQLVAWDPEHRQLVSMYRFADTAQIMRDFGIEALRTATLFDVAPEFQRDYLSRAVELGRSVVNREARRAIAGLFAVWSGLGVLAQELTHAAFFFGNVTLPAGMAGECRDAIIAFLHQHYSTPALRSLVRAKAGMGYEATTTLRAFASNPVDAREELIAFLAARGAAVPPILLSYLGAADEIQIFDTARDADFGDAWEIAIAVPFAAANAKTRARFFNPYRREPGGYFDR